MSNVEEMNEKLGLNQDQVSAAADEILEENRKARQEGDPFDVAMLEELRTHRGLSRSEMAKLGGVTSNSIYHIETTARKRSIVIGTMRRYLAVLNYGVRIVAHGIGDEPIPLINEVGEDITPLRNLRNKLGLRQADILNEEIKNLNTVVSIERSIIDDLKLSRLETYLASLGLSMEVIITDHSDDPDFVAFTDDKHTLREFREGVSQQDIGDAINMAGYLVSNYERSRPSDLAVGFLVNYFNQLGYTVSVANETDSYDLVPDDDDLTNLVFRKNDD